MSTIQDSSAVRMKAYKDAGSDAETVTRLGKSGSKVYRLVQKDNVSKIFYSENGKETLQLCGENNEYATICWKNKTCSGYFKDGVINQGVMEWSNGNRYAGRLNRHGPNGLGKVTYANGDQYLGEFKNNKMDGSGQYQKQNGSLYLGNLQDNKKHGKGKFQFSDHPLYVEYEGDFEKDNMHGLGRLTFNNGDIYSGSFKEGVIEGLGVLFKASGDMYVGEFHEDKLKDKTRGVWVQTNGDVYFGTFENGEPARKHLILSKNAPSRLELSDGAIFINVSNRSVMGGIGTLFSANGDIHVGLFEKNGLESERGVWIQANGDVYYGPFKNGEPVGEGFIFSKTEAKSVTDKNMGQKSEDENSAPGNENHPDAHSVVSSKTVNTTRSSSDEKEHQDEEIQYAYQLQLKHYNG